MGNKTAEAYPLSWPVGYKRKISRINSRFKNLTVARAAEELESELDKLRAKDVVLSTNIPLKLSGAPRSGISVDDPGVAVYFKRNDVDVVLCCDNYKKVEDNIKAIARTLSALRQISRDGVSDFLERAFTGFKALPQEASPSDQDWWEIMSIPKDSTFEQIESRYRELAKVWHPDTGDDTGRFFLLSHAMKRAKEQFNR